jgi:hypothetical protein
MMACDWPGKISLGSTWVCNQPITPIRMSPRKGSLKVINPPSSPSPSQKRMELAGGVAGGSPLIVVWTKSSHEAKFTNPTTIRKALTLTASRPETKHQKYQSPIVFFQQKRRCRSKSSSSPSTKMLIFLLVMLPAARFQLV